MEQKEENIEEKKEENIEEKKEEKNEEKKEGQDEETTDEYILRCEKCLLVPIIKIDHKTYKIHCQCENNHIKSDISISRALNENEKISFKKCSSCAEKSEEDNFVCIQCLKVFCLDGGCKKKHAKENPAHKLIDANTFDSTCLEHFISFSKYCEDCKRNICAKCQREKHNGHTFVDLGEILTSNEEIEEGKKLYEEKREKLSLLKSSISEWLKEFNQKVNDLIASIDAELLINKNILKSFKSNLSNYQMIENFNYFSSKKSVESYTNSELLGFTNEKSWFPKTVLIAQALSKQQQQMVIDTSDNNKNKVNNDINFSRPPSHTMVMKKAPSANINYNKVPSPKIARDENVLSKALPSLSPASKDAIKPKNYYWNLNETKNTTISQKLFKSNLEVTEKIYSGLIDNKGIIFFGGDSSLHIYRFDLKGNKIEKEFSIKGLDGAVNTIVELRDDFLLVGTSNGTIKIIEFMVNKKHRIHQEIRNTDKDSIYKVIELSNYSLVSCHEKNITFYWPKPNNYYEFVQEVNINSPTCCILEIEKGIIAASHPTLKKISFYEIKDKKLNLRKEIENIESNTNDNSLSNMNEHYFCSISNKNIFIFSSKNLELVKKVELKIETISVFPISCGMILFCHYKENDKGKNELSLSLKTFDDKNKELFEIDQNIVSKNKDAKEQIYFVNFFDPNYMVIASEKNIDLWG